MVKIKILSFVLVSFFIGYQAHKADLFPLSDFFERLAEGEIPEAVIKYSVFRKKDGKQEVTCPNANDALVIAVMGQSNASNSGGHRFENNNHKILNFYNGKCFVANDPMLGASGRFGSIWIPFARKIKTDKTILISSFAVNASTLNGWLSEDGLLPHYKRNITSLLEAGYLPDFVIWMQGEADRSRPPAEFSNDLKNFLGMVQKDVPDTTIALSGTSYCHGGVAEIVQEQKNLSDVNGYLWLGNTDQFIDAKYRYDDCHLSEQGMRGVASMFATAINKHLQ